MKKIISITLCAALLALSGCSQNTSSDALSSDISSAASESQSTASQEESSGLSQSGNGGFKVEGTKLLDANGKEFIMRGINHAHTWYLDEDTTAIKAIAETGSNVVRVVCSDGEQWTKDTEDMLETVIDL